MINPQLEFFQRLQREREFGGILLQLRRRRTRPLSTREAIHLVLRSSWACGPFGLLKRRAELARILAACARSYGVRVYRFAIANNHLHLLVRLHSRNEYRKFIRVFSSKVANQVMDGLSFREFIQAHPQGQTSDVQGIGQRFWQYRPYTRIVTWGRDFNNCARYVERNILEALGFIPYQPRRPKRKSRGPPA